MNALLSAASRAGANDLESVKAAIREASSSGQSAVEAAIDKGAMNEREFLEALAEELQWPWHGRLDPDEDSTAELKRACPARLALRHRLLPVSFETLPPHGEQ